MIFLRRESFLHRDQMLQCHVAADWSDMFTVLNYHLGGRWQIFSETPHIVIEVRNVWDAKLGDATTAKTKH